ncbi:C-type lectin domain family 3 member A-like [Ruditapes philippinarum]|uniref:C-type lectin domain family 3 member A-like n=1 Tax=Ruditapes philippinarum TaxID=129788 RepID=UPI00295C00C3|nr:C-type lectin domain family 3 member A-like [Ruditapes philippinarum]
MISVVVIMQLRVQAFVLLLCIFVNVCFSEEKSCSPYDFQEKILEKVLRMEFEFKEMQKNVKVAQIAVDTSVKSVENQIEELEGKTDKFMENLAAKMKAFDDLYNTSRLAHGPKTCLDGWIFFQNSCYTYGKDDVQFYEAQRYCKQFDAGLVNIESYVENIFLRNFLKELKAPNHWIGLTDVEQEGDWRHYPSLKEVTFFDWGRHQPNNGRVSNCAAFWESFQHHWVDEPCTNTFRPLCEMKLNSSE